VLLDTQFTTEHLKRFGAIDVPRTQQPGASAIFRIRMER
jgi:Leu/Phe-tRNA-protein transferase